MLRACAIQPERNSQTKPWQGSFMEGGVIPSPSKCLCKSEISHSHLVASRRSTPVLLIKVEPGRVDSWHCLWQMVNRRSPDCRSCEFSVHPVAAHSPEVLLHPQQQCLPLTALGTCTALSPRGFYSQREFSSGVGAGLQGLFLCGRCGENQYGNFASLTHLSIV